MPNEDFKERTEKNMEIGAASHRDVELLYLREIAAWQVKNKITQSHLPNSGIEASLPALQRGSVWRAPQIESLWDSIIRGFPIGSFLLMPYQVTMGHQPMLLSTETNSAATHMLLDGQQRATAIALGFYTPWGATQDITAPAALWIDLGAAPAADREFCFRLITRAHPWGYPAIGDRLRIEVKDMRLAMEAFRKAQPEITWSRRPPVYVAWPWDAVAPVPVGVALTAAAYGGKNSTLESVLDQMLPHWRKIETRHGRLQEALAKCLRSVHCTRIMTRLRYTTQRYCVPAQMIGDLLFSGSLEDHIKDSHRPDAAETLFIRVNSGGTPLQGEDLMYSIIKAIWPNAADLIESIQHRFVSEARAAMLIARLALAGGQSATIPAIPDVARFRRLVHMDAEHPEFRERMEGYLNGKAAPLFEQARLLLTTPKLGLPPVLAAELTRGESGREIAFLLLRWIEKLNAAGINVSTLTNKQRSRAIGALTAISWFARRVDRCVMVLWPVLEACIPGELPTFFCRKNIQKCFMPIRGEAPMPCLPPPDVLKAQISARITRPGRNDGAFSDAQSKFWSEWRWYERFSNQITGGLSKWYSKVLPDVPSTDNEDSTLAARSLSDWAFFADRLWGERRLVLYAQRKSLLRWFPDFDPTDPDTMEEINRPWDMDHIHPRYFIEGRHNIPQIIRDWHGSIGNLRAWPLDANRSDAEAAPRFKLADPDDVAKGYGMLSAQDQRQASFISEDQWANWEATTPDENHPPGFLSNGRAPYGECRKALIKAITARTSSLYSEWYKQLNIGSLMPLWQKS